MRDMVRSLPARWAGDTARQRQRQFELAVNRGDAEACAALLEASADVNHMRDVTALHVATRRLDVPVAEELLRAQADCSAQDVYGDCPAHYAPLYDTEDALQMFDLVTPSLDVLNKVNVASVTPFRTVQTVGADGTGQQTIPTRTGACRETAPRLPESLI